jgi:hypothetical protein
MFTSVTNTKGIIILFTTVSSLTLSPTQSVLTAVSLVQMQPGHEADLSPVCSTKSRMWMYGSY